MDENYRIAISEVFDVINHSEEAIKSKIPLKLYEFLEKNNDINYNVSINYNDDNWEDYISKDAKEILALIYRDYLVTPEEREKLILEENEEEKRIEAELREKYNPDNLFKKNKYEQEPSRVTETALIKAEDSKWYKNFINKIIKFFKNKLLK